MKARIVLSFVCATVLAIGIGQVSTIAGNRPLEQSSSGPDVVLSSIPNVNRWGPVNNINAYSIGSATCNIGNQNLAWEQLGAPGLAMNAYRLHDGRLE
jgi:hypothetical protein